MENMNIPITMSLDNEYIYPTIVSITSILENAFKETKFTFYILHPDNFTEINKEKLKSFEKKYFKKCKFNFINMKNKYIKLKKLKKIRKKKPPAAYYKLSLPELLPEIDKIIYLDGDTLTYIDLQELYNIDMTNYYYKGLLDNFPECVDHITKKNDHCICVGVMLINLKELRKDNMTSKFDDFIIKKRKQLIQYDQTVINAVSYEKIGILPPKYGIFNYKSKKKLFKKYKNIRYKNKYTNKELENAYLNPGILHMTYKPWIKLRQYKKIDWWKYAKKSDYYNEICENYPNNYPKNFCKH